MTDEQKAKAKELKVPLYLNLAACKLSTKQYTEVLEDCKKVAFAFLSHLFSLSACSFGLYPACCIVKKYIERLPAWPLTRISFSSTFPLLSLPLLPPSLLPPCFLFTNLPYQALEIDPNNQKGLLRQAKANIELDEWDLAHKALARALELDPNNADVKREQAKLKKKIADQAAKDKKVFGGMFEKMSKMDG